ncbi:hypothetical protein PF005_g26837 [Phytophthora fragariae]|uniref:Uncharacterized protein n=1 Tax=Phytophthora fragariae TaxID=53985 RepID=A0A6A3VRI5_9STRA|nr:hypothetical protein PF009_g27255 [Phytophthora fragariae]KAE8972343.1 hypothetical protein PF011_g25671 [Phytophthora fragariae]KAE9070785.1 hypothetical protein PF007_g26808 [Phytophthora fragariae]KAE9086622.1 hypothetical protein PF006_g25985 [Phytophthora fragariae]KAE9172159.1 hypothetical protein PF005_g26837 [Phytophthora fragariae]
MLLLCNDHSAILHQVEACWPRYLCADCSTSASAAAGDEEGFHVYRANVKTEVATTGSDGADFEFLRPHLCPGKLCSIPSFLDSVARH